MANRPLTRELCFYSDPPNGDPPEYIAETTTQPGMRNYAHLRAPMIIQDVRGYETQFSLDTHSFAAIPNAFNGNPNGGVDFSCDTSIHENYLPWVQKLIANIIPESKSTTVFDYTIRKACRTKLPATQVKKIHIDQSPKGAYGCVHRHLQPADIDRVTTTGQRFRIINVWKPIWGPVHDHPLTFADSRTLHETDLVKVKQVYPDYTGETYAVKHGPHQKYWYWSQMTPNDVLLLQCFDSRVTSHTERGLPHTQCAHGSFELDESGNETYKRASIEVRCLVLCESSIKME